MKYTHTKLIGNNYKRKKLNNLCYKYFPCTEIKLKYKRRSDNVTKKANRKCRSKKLKKIHFNILQEHYVFYFILNTSFHMDCVTITKTVARGLLKLYEELDKDYIKGQYIDSWNKSGQNIIILKGYDNNHLRFLKKELKVVATGLGVSCCRHNDHNVISVLCAFGKVDDFEQILDGLSYFK